MTKLLNVKGLNDLFGVDGPDWLELLGEYEPCGAKPVNDIGGKDCFWNNSTLEQQEQRNKSISDTYNSLSEDGWKQLIQHRLKGSTQTQQIVFDNNTFISKNQAARYIMQEYGVSRNTAIRYLDEGRHPKNKKQQGRVYTGKYKGCKYD